MSLPEWGANGRLKKVSERDPEMTPARCLQEVLPAGTLVSRACRNGVSIGDLGRSPETRKLDDSYTLLLVSDPARGSKADPRNTPSPREPGTFGTPRASPEGPPNSRSLRAPKIHLLNGLRSAPGWNPEGVTKVTPCFRFWPDLGPGATKLNDSCTFSHFRIPSPKNLHIWGESWETPAQRPQEHVPGEGFDTKS